MNSSSIAIGVLLEIVLESSADMSPFDPDVYTARAQMIERAGADLIIVAEAAPPSMNASVLAPIVAGATDHIGVVPALSVDYPPYSMARLVNTLDHLSCGRSGWMVVGPDGGQDASGEVDEYIGICRKLWESWEPDAMIEDRVGGIFADPAKVHTVDHVGPMYKVRGPLNMTPSPQRNPPIFFPLAAGSSVDFAARNADVVVISAATVEEFRKIRNELLEAVSRLARATTPQIRITISAEVAEADDVRIAPPAVARQLWPIGSTNVIHLAGTTEDVADGIRQVLLGSGADGVILLAPSSFTDLHRLCNGVLPTLRRQGFLRPRSKPARSLRDQIGLA